MRTESGAETVHPAKWVDARGYGRFETRTCAGCGVVEWYAREFTPDSWINLGVIDDEPEVKICGGCGHSDLWFISEACERDSAGKFVALSGQNAFYLFVCKKCGHVHWRWRRWRLHSVERKIESSPCSECGKREAYREEVLREENGKALPVGFRERLFFDDPIGNFSIELCAACPAVRWIAQGLDGLRPDETGRITLIEARNPESPYR